MLIQLCKPQAGGSCASHKEVGFLLPEGRWTALIRLALLRLIGLERTGFTAHVSSPATAHRYSPCHRLPSSLSHRLQEDDKGGDTIRQLIDTLDLRKDEANQRPSKGVARLVRDIPSP